MESQRQRNEGAGDGSGPGTAIGLDDVAVHADGPLAEPREVHGGPQRTADQALDLRGAPRHPAAVSPDALPRRQRQHPVFGGEPPPAPPPQPPGNPLLDADRGDHARVALADENRTGGRGGENRPGGRARGSPVPRVRRAGSPASAVRISQQPLRSPPESRTEIEMPRQRLGLPPPPRGAAPPRWPEGSPPGCD